MRNIDNCVYTAKLGYMNNYFYTLVMWHKRKMKYLTFILTLILLIACSQNEKKDSGFNMLELPARIVYVSNPKETDTLCISEIERAKKDIAKGKIVFTQSFGFGTNQLRYENELKELCKKNGLEFDVDLIGCVVFEGQTQGCYGDYMDKVIIEKFGIVFKENIHKQADSLFLVNTNSKNKTVQYWDCDERPRLPSESKRTNDNIPSISVKEIDIKENKGEYEGWPFFDLGFIVEKDSTISGFHSRYFVAGLKENKKYEDELFARVVEYIKSEYPIWVPGKINGVPVRTDNNVRVFLTKEE